VHWPKLRVEAGAEVNSGEFEELKLIRAFQRGTEGISP
jgi:hypothetical protein